MLLLKSSGSYYEIALLHHMVPLEQRKRSSITLKPSYILCRR